MRSNRLARTLGPLMVGGITLQLGACADLISNVNPCGPILNCDPAQWEFVTSGIDGPRSSPDEDPFCTFPPFCDATQAPIFGGLNGDANP